ncbi:MAG TPA: histidine--tRNA ligase [Clostridiaceae bacterium]|nr:histidine--tRNA ligase [Clostridiaceae bacterium]
MAFIKTPVRGMPEQTPLEMELRNYVFNQIRKVYHSYGYLQIETPAIEHIENLTGDQGGENEKLMFRLLKRGESLQRALKEGGDLSAEGLRFDLTVPMTRFYANNMSDLPIPFKVMQMGPVWRADRPQRGRFRQFVQCDIDILGEATKLAEIELISATVEALSSLGFEDLVVKVNDRRILRAMALFAGFPQDELNDVYILLDKMDKIGFTGLRDELITAGYSHEITDKYLGLFRELPESTLSRSYFENNPEILSDIEIFENLDQILTATRSLTDPEVNIIFDPTLVRGMGYYTGTIFEVSLPGMAGSVAGGGRYDEMIEKYVSQPVPACGFSIGFERIIVLLEEQGLIPGFTDPRTAYLLDKDLEIGQIVELMQEANKRRVNGETIFIAARRRNVRRQIEELEELGYTQFEEISPE